MVVIGLGALLAMALLWPGEQEVPAANPAQSTEVVNATLLGVEEVEGADNTGLTPGAVTVAVRARIDETGQTVEFETTDETGSLYRAGQRVRLASISQEGLPATYFIADFRRSGPLIVLAALFVAAVVSFGRVQGVRALLGLAITFFLIVGFMIPAILDGTDPLAVAIVGSLLIMIVTLYLSHGISAKTTAAVVGTALALLVTGVLAVIFVGAANVTGFASEEARQANFQAGGLSLRGLLLAGIVIGGLGVLDDVTMTQASAVFQLRRANPAARFRKLVAGALAVGRDHVAATVNTLFLAYAGAALPLLILFAGSPDSLGTVVATETVAVEIIRTLVGSVGLITAVPLTTALAAALVLGESSRLEGSATIESKLQRDSIDQNSIDVIESDPEWEQRLREAYRLPPRKHDE
ncbi:MAG: YibE/F family protein [Nitriliruptorales bacterium]|nr:YibE/F family protein [Nitriliruptorales bacterium]